MSAINHFSTYSPTSWSQSFIFLSAGTLKEPGVFSSNWKKKDTSLTNFPCLSNHPQPSGDLSKGATIHNQTCPYVYSFRWRPFWAFAVNCDLINNNYSIFTKFWTCPVNVLCQLYVKYYKLRNLSLKAIFQLNSNPLIFGLCSYEILLCFLANK